ncbi:MAG TPA: selenocysteine-specific translation elongation factor [Actinomycetota bacterium]|nr:selenocysteine-specific translation elongation factor [Actinomycetota bacterium]
MHVIGTAGHVDHGKSALVHALTGIDPDRFAEEKRRGLTIDLGFAWLTLPSGREIGIVDVPGHERFIKNMLAGAGGISVVLFVVSAPEGWMPQSAEHLAALEVLGVESGVVALTKADLVDEARLGAVRAEVESRLATTGLHGAPMVPVSAVTGEGLHDLVAALDGVVDAAPPAKDADRPRLWVDRSFVMQGAGTVVTGTLGGGSFAVADEVDVMPGARRARIRGIQSHKRSVERVGPGVRTALNLAGLERAEVARGDAVVRRGAWRVTKRLDAHVRVLPRSICGHDYSLTSRGAHLLFAGSAETPVRVKLLGSAELAGGDEGYAQLYLRDPLPLAHGDRFVLRDAGRAVTFGGGQVLDPEAAPAKSSDSRRAAMLAEMRTERRLVALVRHVGMLRRAEALRRAAVSSADDVPALGDLFVSEERLAALERAARRALETHHRDHPLERGAPREVVRAATELDTAAFDALVEGMDDVVADGAVLRLSSHGPTLTPAQQQARDSLLAAIEEGGFAPPLAKDLNADPALVRMLVERGELVRIDDFYLTAARAAELRAKVRSLIETHGPVTVAQVRDALGTTRKYAVPICEWLDRTQATRRKDDLRTLGPNP